MKLDTSTLMFFFFIILLTVSIWKIYAFLPNKELADDDRTEESKNELMRLTLHVINSHNGELSEKELFDYILKDEDFDKERYWRFNQNRLNQLLNSYYLSNPHCSSIADIYQDLK